MSRKNNRRDTGNMMNGGEGKRCQQQDTESAHATRMGDAAKRLEGAGGRQGLTVVVFVGGAVIRVLDNHDVVGNGLPVAKGGQRIAVRIKQGKIKIAGTGSTDALLVLKPEFNLKQHAGFLLEGVIAGERDLEAVAFGGADRRFSEHP